MLLLVGIGCAVVTVTIQQLGLADPAAAPWPTFHVGRHLALRGFGFMFFLIFFAVHSEAALLIGHKGITPAAALLHKQCESAHRWQSLLCAMPTAMWEESDAAITVLCGAGGALSAAFALGRLHYWPLLLLVAWMYRSISSVGGIWFGYAWEPQLIETSVTMALCLCSLCPRFSSTTNSTESVLSATASRWGVTLLVFRVMAAAGKLKMRADPCWREYTCFERHFENMPMPNPLSHVAHHLPPTTLAWLQWMAIDIAELYGPWLLLVEVAAWPLLTSCAQMGWASDQSLVKHVRVAGCARWLFNATHSIVRVLRSIGAGLPLLLMVGIMATGNYAFLNVLMALPCIALIDDTVFGYASSQMVAAAAPASIRTTLTSSCAVVLLVGLLAVSTQGLCWIGTSNNHQLSQCLEWHSTQLWQSGQVVGLGNKYTSGRFASITEKRYEMVLWAQNASSGMWAELDIPCKVGSVDRMPCFTAPYHRRLAWQFWFLGLGGDRRWFDEFARQLLVSDSVAWAAVEVGEVHSFSATHLPIALEAHAYQYKMAPLTAAHSGSGGWRNKPDTREHVAGAWWNRTYLGLWMDPMRP